MEGGEARGRKERIGRVDMNQVTSAVTRYLISR